MRYSPSSSGSTGALQLGHNDCSVFVNIFFVSSSSSADNNDANSDGGELSEDKSSKSSSKSNSPVVNAELGALVVDCPGGSLNWLVGNDILSEGSSLRGAGIRNAVSFFFL